MDLDLEAVYFLHQGMDEMTHVEVVMELLLLLLQRPGLRGRLEQQAS